MAVLPVPTRTAPSLGTVKSNANAVTNEPQQLSAPQYNVCADDLIAVIIDHNLVEEQILTYKIGIRENHALASAAGTTVLLWQGNGTNVDDTGNHTFAVTGVAAYSPGDFTGTLEGRTDVTRFYSTTTNAGHRQGGAMSAYGLFNLNPTGSGATPYVIMSGVNGAAGTINYGMVFVGGVWQYQDSTNGLIVPATPAIAWRTQQTVWWGFTRSGETTPGVSADSVIKLFINGKKVQETGGQSDVLVPAGDFFIGSVGGAAAGVAEGGHQSIKIVDAELSEGEMLQESARTHG